MAVNYDQNRQPSEHVEPAQRHHPEAQQELDKLLARFR